MGFQRRSAWIGFLSCTPASIERFDWSFCPVRLYPCLMRPPQTHTLCSLSGHKQKQFQRRRLNCHHALDGFFSYQATTQKPNRWSALGSFYHMSFDMIFNLHLSLVPLQSNRHLWFQGKKQNVLVCFPCWRSRDNSQWPLPLLFECLQVRHQCTLTSVCTGKEDSQKTLTSMWLQYLENLSGCFAYNVFTGKISEEW